MAEIKKIGNKKLIFKGVYDYDKEACLQFAVFSFNGDIFHEEQQFFIYGTEDYLDVFNAIKTEKALLELQIKARNCGRLKFNPRKAS